MKPRKVAQAYFDAWNQHDADAVLDCFGADGTYEDPAAGEVLSGKSIGGYVRGLFAAFPDLAFEIESLQASDEGLVAVQWSMRGTNSGSYAGLPPTGSAVNLSGATFIEVADGKIRSVKGYFDGRSVSEQLGLQVVVQPNAIGPFQFGTATAVQTGNPRAPGAVGVISLRLRSDDEAREVRQLSNNIVAEMQEMPGFIGYLGVTVGGRMITITSWESPAALGQLQENDAYKQALAKFFAADLGAGGMTGVLAPLGGGQAWARCTACGKMKQYATVGQACDCGAVLGAPAYW